MLYLDTLREEVERFTNADPHRVKGEFKEDASQYAFDVPLPPFPPDWTLLVGDFAYNRRASLDYLVTALVRSTGKKENTRNEFPIYRLIDSVGWQGMSQWWDTERTIGRKLENTPTGTRAALKPLQPFYGVPVTNPDTHPLWQLSLLNNRDKHRRLNLLSRPVAIDFVGGDGKPIFDIPVKSRFAERSERDTQSVTLTVQPDKANMDVYLLATYEVAFHEPPELIGDLVQTLTGINEFIDARVLPVVRSLL